MKNLYLVVFLFIISLSCLDAAAQENRQAKHQVIYGDIGVSFRIHGNLNLPVSIEYMRQWKNNLYWGVSLSQQFEENSTYDLDILKGPYYYMNSTPLTVFVRYRMPLVKKRFFMDVAAGFGITAFRMKEISRNEGFHDMVRPHFKADLYLTYANKRGVEFRITPFLPINLLLLFAGWGDDVALIPNPFWLVFMRSMPDPAVGDRTTKYLGILNFSVGFKF